MDFHLLQRVRSQSAQDSLKKLKRPKVKLTSPKWTKDGSVKKRPRVFFPEGDEESDDTSSVEEKEEKEEDMDVSDIIRKMRIRLRKLESRISKNNKSNQEEIIEDVKKTKKRLSFGKVKKTPSKSKGLRIDPLLNRKRSFWDYVLDDFDWRSVSTPREAIAEQQRLNNFQQIPWAIECLQCFGFFVCFDTLLYVVFKNIFCFAIPSCHSNDKNITRVSHSYDKKKKPLGKSTLDCDVNSNHQRWNTGTSSRLFPFEFYLL